MIMAEICNAVADVSPFIAGGAVLTALACLFIHRLDNRPICKDRNHA